jgi:CRP-like cAMP-binding protein
VTYITIAIFFCERTIETLTLFKMRAEPAMLKSTSQAITSTAILSSLPERLSAPLFAGAKSCQLRAGEELFAAGDSGDGCYRLEHGLLKVIITSPRGEQRILAILGPGEIAGELSLIDRQSLGSVPGLAFGLFRPALMPTQHLRGGS